MKLSLKVLSTSVFMLAMSCSDGLEPSGGKEREGDGPTVPGGVQEAGGTQEAAQLTAFASTLHPLLTAHCSQCHASVVAPNFAQSDTSLSLKVITTAQLVSLETAAQSRLVKRLAEQAHNCWSDCAANATEFSTAITAWAAKAGSGVAATADFKKSSQTLISEAGEVFLTGGIGKSWVLAAAYSDGYGEALAPLDDPKASQRKVMYRVPNYTSLMPAPQGGAHYYLDIPNADTEKYQLCFRVKTNITVPEITNPVNFGSRVFVQINGSGRVGTRDLNATGVQPDAAGAAQVGTSYVWMPAFYAPDPNNAAVQIPTAFNLKPMKGSTKLDLYIRETEPAIDLIAVSGTSATCSAGAVPNTGRVFGFAFDISDIVGVPAKFYIQYQKTADGKAQVFNRPTIETEDPSVTVHVEQIYVVINDSLDKTLSTFASVNTDVTGGGAMLSTADLIVPFGAAEDKVSIHFGKISLVTP